MTYTAFLGLSSLTEPNASTGTISYDAFARPSSSTSPHGAVTTYAYTTSPPTVTATTSGRWTKTTMDGFGNRTLVTVTKGTAPGGSLIIDPTNNLISSPGVSSVLPQSAMRRP